MRRFAIVVCLLALPGRLLAQDGRVCAVKDPTGTPLIRGAYDNGAMVRIYETASDARGEPWVRIAPVERGPSGWVIRKFIDCPSG